MKEKESLKTLFLLNDLPQRTFFIITREVFKKKILLIPGFIANVVQYKFKIET